MSDSKTQDVELKFSRVILNKTKKNRIRNTNLRFELRVDEIKNDIKKSRLSWFGHVIWMREGRIPEKMLYTKMEGTAIKTETQNQMARPN